MKYDSRADKNDIHLSIKNEMIAIFLLFFTIFLTFSLISYTPRDASFFHTTFDRNIVNFGGGFGSEIAALLMNAFGFSAYILVLASLFFTTYFLMNRRIQSIFTKSFGYFLLMLSSSALMHGLRPLLSIDGLDVPSGGFFGSMLHALLAKQIKPFFTSLLFLLLALLAVVLVARISIRRLFGALLHILEKLFHTFIAHVKILLEDHQKNKQIKKIAKKYQDDSTTDTPMKTFAREKDVDKPPKEPGKTEKKPIARQPSRLPEETLLFTEFKESTKNNDGYQPPPLTYLDATTEKSKIDRDELEEKKKELSQRLSEFRINGKIVEYTPGPVITTYEFVPDTGVKVKDVSGLTEDLALVVKAQYVRIERILGKKAIGIEIPNKKREIIHLRELIESPLYQRSASPLTIALGKTTSGEIFISDLRDMPHLIIAGATGSGKSVAIHTIILSILYKSSPKQVRFILIDPKQIELAIYNTLPHLLTPVVVNPKFAKNALDWAVFEMESRYKKLATLQVRDIQQYNKKLELLLQSGDESFEHLEDKEKLPYIVIIIDELADLMMTSGREVEDSIARIAQKARAVGIHLILATQRPSVDVITGTIKNNFPSRIALAVPSKHDSRTIIDQMGAEKLLGNGDMLFLPPKTATLIRLHCSYVSEEEAIRVVNFLSKLEKPEFNTQIIKHSSQKENKEENEGDLDEMFFQAAETVITTGQASASYLQRKLSVGYARAGRIMDQLQEQGVVSPANSKNQRDILVSINDLHKLKDNYEKGE